MLEAWNKRRQPKPTSNITPPLPILGCGDEIADEDLACFLGCTISLFSEELWTAVKNAHPEDFYSIALYGEMIDLAQRVGSKDLNEGMPGVSSFLTYSFSTVNFGFAKVLYDHRNPIKALLEKMPHRSYDRVLIADALAVAMAEYDRQSPLDDYEDYESGKAPAPWPLQYAWQVKAEFYVATEEAA